MFTDLYLLDTEEDTINFAHKLCSTLRSNTVVSLYGEIGVGKTVICREIVKFFCGNDVYVPSPTFTILNVYDGPFPIHHVDLYRITTTAEIEEIGLSEALMYGLTLIEWPLLAEPLLPPHTIKIYLSYSENNMRIARICAASQ